MKSGLAFGLIVLLFACSVKTEPVLNREAVSRPRPQSAQFAMPFPPDLDSWLEARPRIANAIKWQFRPAGASDPYTPPDESSKIAWPNWSPDRKEELTAAYLEACFWVAGGFPRLPFDQAGLTDHPVNLHPGKANDASPARQWVSASYMWKLYIAHVAFSLAQELTNALPWSISDYDDESLRYLFDSTTMAWDIGEQFTMGTSEEQVPVNRADNLPRSAFAPPTWTYLFFAREGLTGASRIETIAAVLDWMRYHLTHFYGNNSFGTYEAIWQYRGYPPLSAIVNGTVDGMHPELGRKHWIAGCHRSVGFLNEVLRVVNIPVQPVWICEHEVPYFISEKLYMAHADDIYNDHVRNSGVPILSMLIDEATYSAWFTDDAAVNIIDNRSPACGNIGRKIEELIGGRLREGSSPD